MNNNNSVLDVTPPLILCASFVADPLAESLGRLMVLAGLRVSVELGPYHQVFQCLLAPDSALTGVSGGINVLLLRLEDFARDHDDTAGALAVVESVVNDLPPAIEAAVGRTGRPLLVAVFAASPNALGRLGQGLEEMRQRLLLRLKSIAGLSLIQDDEIERVACGAREDAEADRLAHIPFVDTHFASLALAVARKAHALLQPAHKVLVLDCDNTLWRGVVGEDGVAGLDLPAGMLALQRRAVELHGQGVLIALASKNVSEDVDSVFASRPDMVLRPEHIVARRVNWQPKPENLRSLAQELNLGLDSFVFIDDNPVECAQMRSVLPQVVTLQLPADADAIPAFLDHLWTFDRVAITDEDRQRTAMYRENQARRQSESSASSFGEFIATLEMQIDIAVPNQDEWARISQLSQRTNQFNFTTRRYTETELRTWASHEDGGVLRVRVRDRFGDYGLVGVAVCSAVHSDLLVDSFFLSCRVLGRGVEHALLAHLGKQAVGRRLDQVRLPFRPTPKNLPAQAFADSVAGEWRTETPEGEDFVIPAQVAADLRYRLGEVPEAVMNALRDDEKKALQPAAQPVDSAGERSTRYSLLATELINGPAVLAWVQGMQRQARILPDLAVPPSGELEAAMLALWTEVLQIDGLGVEDDFHALGCTSLQAARLIASVERRFGPRWPFTTLLTARTPRALVGKLEEDRAGVTERGLVTLRPGRRTPLFFVHDGDGETLLYRNLALQLPEEVGVVGIEPVRLPGIPLAHLCIEDMASAYIANMRSLQPEGPYRLAGLCAGGVIAYEMARQLQAGGNAVEFVVMLDAAAPGTPRRAGIGGQRRLARTLAATRGATGGWLTRVGIMGAMILRRSWNYLRWRVTDQLFRIRRSQRFARLAAVLNQRATWPAHWAPLSVREIYDEAERRYRPARLDSVPLLLVRATAGDGADTPYTSVYADPDLGWGRVGATRLQVVDVSGGHSSMLQEPHLASLAQFFCRHMGHS